MEFRYVWVNYAANMQLTVESNRFNSAPRVDFYSGSTGYPTFTIDHNGTIGFSSVSGIKTIDVDFYCLIQQIADNLEKLESDKLVLKLFISHFQARGYKFEYFEQIEN